MLLRQCSRAKLAQRPEAAVEDLRVRVVSISYHRDILTVVHKRALRIRYAARMLEILSLLLGAGKHRMGPMINRLDSKMP